MHTDVDHRWGRRELAVNSRAWVASSRLDFARTLRAVERHSRIVIIQKDQSAVGDSGTFDMKVNAAVLVGNVVLTQGQNVVRGDQLTADLNTGLLRIETKKAGQGHVQSVFVRNSGDKSPRDAEKDMRHPMLAQPLPLR